MCQTIKDGANLTTEAVHIGLLHIGRAPAGMLYVLVWNSVCFRDSADLHFPYTYSLQSSMWSKCSAHRFAKLSIRGTVGFYVFLGNAALFLYSIYLWMYT